MDIYNKGKKTYAIGFLLNDKQNKASQPIPFKVAKDSVLPICKTAINKPWIPGDPKTNSRHFEPDVSSQIDNLDLHMARAGGIITDIISNPSTENVSFIIELDPDWAESLKNQDVSKISPFLSPMLDQIEQDPATGEIVKAVIVHVHSVNVPGYDPSIAKFTGTCDGTRTSCKQELAPLAAAGSSSSSSYSEDKDNNIHNSNNNDMQAQPQQNRRITISNWQTAFSIFKSKMILADKQNVLTLSGSGRMHSVVIPKDDYRAHLKVLSDSIVTNTVSASKFVPREGEKPWKGHYYRKVMNRTVKVAPGEDWNKAKKAVGIDAKADNKSKKAKSQKKNNIQTNYQQPKPEQKQKQEQKPKTHKTSIRWDGEGGVSSLTINDKEYSYMAYDDEGEKILLNKDGHIKDSITDDELVELDKLENARLKKEEERVAKIKKIRTAQDQIIENLRDPRSDSSNLLDYWKGELTKLGEDAEYFVREQSAHLHHQFEDEAESEVWGTPGKKRKKVEETKKVEEAATQKKIDMAKKQITQNLRDPRSDSVELVRFWEKELDKLGVNGRSYIQNHDDYTTRFSKYAPEKYSTRPTNPKSMSWSAYKTYIQNNPNQWPETS